MVRFLPLFKNDANLFVATRLYLLFSWFMDKKLTVIMTEATYLRLVALDVQTIE